VRKFIALLHARNMEFLRDRGTLFWNLVFPLFLVFGFAFAFSGQDENLFKVGVLDRTSGPNAFLEESHIEFVDYSDADEALNKLRHHQIDMVIDIAASEYRR
jgi:ABC-2 type transport system permease protein